jgi:hypothetical protein
MTAVVCWIIAGAVLRVWLETRRRRASTPPTFAACDVVKAHRGRRGAHDGTPAG